MILFPAETPESTILYLRTRLNQIPGIVKETENIICAFKIVQFLYCSPYRYHSSNCAIAIVVTLKLKVNISLSPPKEKGLLLIIIERANKKRNKEPIPKMNRRRLRVITLRVETCLILKKWIISNLKYSIIIFASFKLCSIYNL